MMISTGSCVVSLDAKSASLVLPAERRNENVPFPLIAEVTLTSTQVPVVVRPRFARLAAPPILGALFQVMVLWLQLLLTRYTLPLDVLGLVTHSRSFAELGRRLNPVTENFTKLR